jgi:hypothetical protein
MIEADHNPNNSGTMTMKSTLTTHSGFQFEVRGARPYD